MNFRPTLGNIIQIQRPTSGSNIQTEPETSNSNLAQHIFEIVVINSCFKWLL